MAYVCTEVLGGKEHLCGRSNRGCGMKMKPRAFENSGYAPPAEHKTSSSSAMMNML